MTATRETPNSFRFKCAHIIQTWTNWGAFGLLRQFVIITDDELAMAEMPLLGTPLP